MDEVTLKEHLFTNMWKPLLLHTILQLSWLSLQIKFEFSSWLFYSVMIILFGLLVLWPIFERQVIEYLIKRDS